MLIIYVVAFIAIFYFMAIRPQQRQRRAHQELISSLKKGDSVATAGGIYGTVKRIEDGVVVVEIARGVSIRVARRAITEVIRDQKDARTRLEGTGRRGKADIEPEEEPVDIEASSDNADREDADRASIAEEFKGEDSGLRGRFRKNR
jgi:preprotein translocase subunit YajC